ncbi:MAG: hypothetical protein ACR2QB_07840, partial [Gammaproteobacteria bacterium]
MSFLTEFDELNTKKREQEANELLFERIQDNRDTLFRELRKERPVLKFWSRHPGNPDIKDKKGNKLEGNPDWAFLLTKEDDVKGALDDLKMEPLAMRGFFVLAEDDDKQHSMKRKKLDAALKFHDKPTKAKPKGPPTVRTQAIEMIDKAIDATWREYTEDLVSGDELLLDYRAFTKDVALRFTGLSFGIPEPMIFNDDPHKSLQASSSLAYERFIWKIHARHFVDAEPDPDNLALKIIWAMVETLYDGQKIPGTPTGVIAAMKKQETALGSKEAVIANLVGAIQGLIDNAMTGSSYALAHLLAKPAKLKKAQALANAGKLPQLKTLLQEAHQQDTPSPFLPRRGEFTQLPADGPKGKHNFALAIGSAITESLANGGAKTGNWDIRMGYGKHDCIGRYLGDELMVRMLAKVLSIKKLKQVDDFEKQWGWIVK